MHDACGHAATQAAAALRPWQLGRRRSACPAAPAMPKRLGVCIMHASLHRAPCLPACQPACLRRAPPQAVYRKRDLDERHLAVAKLVALQYDVMLLLEAPDTDSLYFKWALGWQHVLSEVHSRQVGGQAGYTTPMQLCNVHIVACGGHLHGKGTQHTALLPLQPLTHTCCMAQLHECVGNNGR